MIWPLGSPFNAKAGIWYKYDHDREVFTCSCGFRIAKNRLTSEGRRNGAEDELTVHEIAHRLIDE